MAPTLLLDLDGTLVHSVPDLLASMNRLMAAQGLPPFAAPELTRMVGDGAAALVRRAMAARRREVTPADVEAFTADYTAHAAVASRLFDGIAEALQALAGEGWRMAVCTNKPERASRVLLEALGLLPLLAAVGGGDSFPVHKPDPAHLLATLHAAGGSADRALMVGDHRNDVAAAHGAGIPCIWAGWGYGTPEMAAGADARAERPEELPGVVRAMVARSAASTVR